MSRFSVKDYSSYTNKYFKNPYQFNAGRVSSDLVDTMSNYFRNTRFSEDEITQKRSGWDRIGDLLMTFNYASAGLADGIVGQMQDREGYHWYTPYKQAGQGLLAGLNFLGKGDTSSEYTYSKVLENSGWKPESLAGKIAKGTVGFVGDVLLDPTTYLTGGVSAVVKGTGRTAKITSDVAKIADDVPYMQFDNTVERLTSKGVSLERAEKYATKKFDELTSMNLNKPTYMTDKMASEVIQYESRTRNIPINYKTLDQESKQFASKWNQMRGIRDVNGGAPVTFGVANMPFGQYVAPKMGALGKTIEISSGNGLRKFADMTKVSTVYSRTRDSLYASKLGKLFSTNSGVQKAARTNPSEFFELMKFASMKTGLAGNKVDADKKIFEMARTMNFSDSETKQILKALEDKTILSKVKQTIKFSDTAKGKDLARTLEKGVQEADASYQDIFKEKQHLEMLKKGVEDDLSSSRDVYNNMRTELNQKFVNLKLDGVKNVEDQQKYVELIKEQIKELDDDVKKFTPQSKVADGEIDEVVAERITNLEKLAKDADLKRTGEIESAQRSAVELGQQRSETSKTLLDSDAGKTYLADEDKTLRTAIDATGKERYIGMMDDVTDRSAKFDLIEEISMYAFGRKDGIPRNTSLTNIQPLANLIKGGATPSEVADFIYENGTKYSEHFAEVNKFIAKQLGYKDWNKEFVEPMKHFDEILKSGKELSPFEHQERLRLMNLNAVRSREYQRLYHKLSYDEFKQIRSELANQSMIEDVRHLLETPNSKKPYQEFGQPLDKLDLEEMNYDATTQFLNKYHMKMKDLFGEEKIVPNPQYKRLEDLKGIATFMLQISKDNKNLNLIDSTNQVVNKIAQRYQELVKKKVFSGNPREDLLRIQAQLESTPKTNKHQTSGTQVSRKDLKSGDNTIPDAQKRIEAQASRMVDVLKHHFPGQSYRSLTQTEKGLVRKIAASKKQYAVVQKAEFKRAVKNEVARDNEMKRIESIIDNVNVGHRVMYQGEKNLRAGDVVSTGHDEYGTFFNVRTKGEDTKVYARDVKRVESQVPKKKPEELIQSSKPAQSYLEDRANLEKRLNDEIANLSSFEDANQKVLADFVQESQGKLNAQKNVIADLEKSHTDLINTMKNSADENEMLSLASKIEMKRNALNNEDALVSYFKSMEGEESFIKYMSSENAFAGAKIILDDSLDASQRVEATMKFLRAEFDRMGAAEVEIGKLTEKQFASMVGQYLPHILTEDGMRYIEKHKSKDVFPSGLTSDLGYGTKFNPYATSREIQGNVEDINKYFADKLKGKNFFSESVSQIYLTRALKHNELMYDEEYMRTMMTTFGKQVTNGVVEEGYSGVVNIGLLKEHVRGLVNDRVDLSRANGFPITEELYQSHTRSVLHGYGLPENALDEIATPMVKLSTEQIEKIQKTGLVHAVSDNIVEQANRARQVSIARDQNRFLQMHDKFLHWVKLNQTTVMPHFHIRNKMSNFYQNWLAIGSDAVNPRMQVNATKAVMAKGDYEKLRGLEKMQYVDAQGNVNYMGWDELWDLAVVHDVVDTGVFAKDIGAGAASSGFLKNVLPAKWNPTDTRNFKPYQIGGEVGSTIDNSDRLVHMASLMRQGKTPVEAAESAKKYLFDYSDLTGFEQNVMKRILPYYTWLRKNGKLQAQQVIEQPGKYRDTQKAMQWVNGMNNEEDRIDPRYQFGFAQDWIQLPQSDKAIAEGKDPIILNPFLPFMDLNQIPDLSRPSETAKNYLAQTNAIFKTPLELAMNRNIFFDSEIVHEDATTSEKVGAVLRHLVLQTAGGSAVDGLVRKDGEHLGRHIAFLLTGVKTLSYDEERAKGERIFEYYKEKDGSDFEAGARGLVDNVVEGFKSGFKSLKGVDYDQETQELVDIIRYGQPGNTTEAIGKLRSKLIQENVKAGRPATKNVENTIKLLEKQQKENGSGQQ